MLLLMQVVLQSCRSSSHRDSHGNTIFLDVETAHTLHDLQSEIIIKLTSENGLVVEMTLARDFASEIARDV